MDSLRCSARLLIPCGNESFARLDLAAALLCGEGALHAGKSA